MVKTIIKLLVAALVLNAGYRASMAYYRWFTLKNDVNQVAVNAAKKSQDTVVDEVVEAAGKRQVALARDAVQVRATKDHTFIDVQYTEQLELLPSYQYPWTFHVSAEGRHVKPTTPDDVLGHPK